MEEQEEFRSRVHVLLALNNDNNLKDLPEDLEQILDQISTTGSFSSLQWLEVRSIISWKINVVLRHFFQKHGFTGHITETFESRRAEVLRLLDTYEQVPPFTLQRLCEILQGSKKQFGRTHVLINALAKVLSVGS